MTDDRDAQSKRTARRRTGRLTVDKPDAVIAAGRRPVTASGFYPPKLESKLSATFSHFWA